MSQTTDRILLIDSQQEDLDKLSEYLIAKGYYVVAANSVAEAQNIMGSEVPDLIFADVLNTDIDQIPFFSKQSTLVPLVIVSRAETAGDVVACLRAGASDYILKPVDDYSNVDAVIHRILEKVRIAKLNKRLRMELEEGNKKLEQGIAELRADQQAGLQVQQRLLPDHQKIIHGIEFDHLMKPSLYLSGDFLDYLNLDDEKSLFYFADVSGHGASSAFATVLLKNLMMRLKRNLRRGSSDDIMSPVRFLKRVNQELLHTKIDKHVTIFVGIIDSVKRKLSYSIGGHFPLPIIQAGHKVEYLEGKGMAVGLFDGAEFNSYERDLPEEFSITVFSDGILEVIPGENLSEKENLLLDVVSTGPAAIESLLSSLGVDENEELPDDIAVLTVKELPKDSP